MLPYRHRASEWTEADALSRLRPVGALPSLQGQVLADVTFVHLAVGPAVAIPVRPVTGAVGTFSAAAGSTLTAVDEFQAKQPTVAIAQEAIVCLKETR